jgi:hypothetical protein
MEFHHFKQHSPTSLDLVPGAKNDWLLPLSPSPPRPAGRITTSNVAMTSLLWGSRGG